MTLQSSEEVGAPGTPHAVVGVQTGAVARTRLALTRCLPPQGLSKKNENLCAHSDV